MTTFVIRTDEGDDLGFILFGKHEGEWPPAGDNEVIIAGAPDQPRLHDDLRGRLVLDHKGREWTANLHYTDTEMTVRISFDSGWAMTITSNADGTHWKAARDEKVIGGTGQFL